MSAFVQLALRIAAVTVVVQAGGSRAAVLVDTGLRPAIAMSASSDDLDDGSSNVHEEARRFTIATPGTATAITVARTGSDFDYTIFRDEGGKLVEDFAHLIWQADPGTGYESSEQPLPHEYDVFASNTFGPATLLTFTWLNLTLAAGDYWFELNAADGTGIKTQLIAGLDTTASASRTYNDQDEIPAFAYGVGSELSLKIDGAFAAATVPEPTSWALMIIGFGISGAVLRRRRRSMPGSTATCQGPA